jgi:hypothetical protein
MRAKDIQLLIAITEGDIDKVRAVIKGGADVNVTYQLPNINPKYGGYFTALEIAHIFQQMEIYNELKGKHAAKIPPVAAPHTYTFGVKNNWEKLYSVNSVEIDCVSTKDDEDSSDLGEESLEELYLSSKEIGSFSE